MLAVAANRRLQGQALSFVNTHADSIFGTCCEINRKLSSQDYEDCVSEGQLIALELVGEGCDPANPIFAEQFWERLAASAKASRTYIFWSYVPVEDFIDTDNDKPLPANLRQAAVRASRCDTEEQIERYRDETARTTTLGSVVRFLTPTEGRVVNLLLGEANEGRCTLDEAASVLGITKASVQTLYTRALTKIHEAVVRFSLDGIAVLSNPKAEKMARSAGRRGGKRDIHMPGGLLAAA